jgi:hypothetical protein
MIADISLYKVYSIYRLSSNPILNIQSFTTYPKSQESHSISEQLPIVLLFVKNLLNLSKKNCHAAKFLKEVDQINFSFLNFYYNLFLNSKNI